MSDCTFRYSAFLEYCPFHSWVPSLCHHFFVPPAKNITVHSIYCDSALALVLVRLRYWKQPWLQYWGGAQPIHSDSVDNCPHLHQNLWTPMLSATWLIENRK